MTWNPWSVDGLPLWLFSLLTFSVVKRIWLKSIRNVSGTALQRQGYESDGGIDKAEIYVFNAVAHLLIPMQGSFGLMTLDRSNLCPLCCDDYLTLWPLLPINPAVFQISDQIWQQGKWVWSVGGRIVAAVVLPGQAWLTRAMGAWHWLRSRFVITEARLAGKPDSPPLHILWHCHWSTNKRTWPWESDSRIFVYSWRAARF